MADDERQDERLSFPIIGLERDYRQRPERRDRVLLALAVGALVVLFGGFWLLVLIKGNGIVFEAIA